MPVIRLQPVIEWYIQWYGGRQRTWHHDLPPFAPRPLIYRKARMVILTLHTTFKKLTNSATLRISSLSFYLPSMLPAEWQLESTVPNPPSNIFLGKNSWELRCVCHMSALVVIQVENINSYLKKKKEAEEFCTSQLQFSQILKYHYSINKWKLVERRSCKLGHVTPCICVLEFLSKTEHNIPMR